MYCMPLSSCLASTKRSKLTLTKIYKPKDVNKIVPGILNGIPGFRVLPVAQGQVATHEASAHYADLALLSISVLWMMLLDKHSLFVLVELQCLLLQLSCGGISSVTRRIRIP